MADTQLENLPADAQNLPEGAQNMFRAAFKSAREDGLSEGAAMNVAWNSVNRKYEKGADGQWQRVPQDSNSHHKAITSGGN